MSELFSPPITLAVLGLRHHDVISNYLHGLLTHPIYYRVLIKALNYFFRNTFIALWSAETMLLAY
jgi:hypothetical protein